MPHEIPDGHMMERTFFLPLYGRVRLGCFERFSHGLCDDKKRECAD